MEVERIKISTQLQKTHCRPADFNLSQISYDWHSEFIYCLDQIPTKNVNATIYINTQKEKSSSRG